MGFTSTLRAWRDRKVRNTVVSTAKSRGFQLEPIEPRLLLSGDPALLPFIAQPHPTPPIVNIVLPTATIHPHRGSDNSPVLRYGNTLFIVGANPTETLNIPLITAR